MPAENLAQSSCCVWRMKDTFLFCTFCKANDLYFSLATAEKCGSLCPKHSTLLAGVYSTAKSIRLCLLTEAGDSLSHLPSMEKLQLTHWELGWVLVWFCSKLGTVLIYNLNKVMQLLIWVVPLKLVELVPQAHKPNLEPMKMVDYSNNKLLL